MGMVRSPKKEASAARIILGAEIIKLIIDFEGLLCTGHLCYVYYYIYYFNPHSNPIRIETITYPFYR